MSEVDEHRDGLKVALKGQTDVISQVRRAYFDRPSFALTDKHDVEFEIKKAVADRYEIPFRSVVFSGSAQLGFSPQKDTSFRPGGSDLDIACIDVGLFQRVWQIVMTETRALKDGHKFQSQSHLEKLKEHLLRRGMILLDFMPTCEQKSDEMRFFDGLGRPYRHIFGRISAAIYMNEWAFCWKQASALANILGENRGR